MSSTLETIYRIHDDATSDYLEIGIDADTFELIELRSYSYNNLTNKWDIGQRVTIRVDSIEQVVQALQHFRKV